ncbi:RAMP superfamily CRISPR-associated protein [Sulfuracidifex tepidarius]|uniref:CRISPR type III-associated RAMP protein Csm3 n=1 Tax=Sulfuracidifex tepidarius TaxID=1294262 RepID=A0A510E5I6_9CREN|nr:RAMP superfamily CRISPR-associated protein [Sulfuracidifex tepidarius]BBG27759.1 CRISPR type III-associated RAMP protein Csm3 [Sulfuracidifex tepidarius]
MSATSQPQLSPIKLEAILNINVKLVNKTGLLISAGRALGRIGGADVEPVSIEKRYQCGNESALTRVPYIPGSSLKGRMRSLIETARGLPLYSSDKKIWAHTPTLSSWTSLNQRISLDEFIKDITSQNVNTIFGFSSFSLNDLVRQIEQSRNRVQGLPSSSNDSNGTAINTINKLTPTNLLVEDFFPSEKYVCSLLTEKTVITFDDFLEDKNENRIDRVTSTADPRSVSRVKPNVEFEGKISVLVFNRTKDKIQDILTTVVDGMKLLEETYLGAAGSRGYGRVKFTSLKLSLFSPESIHSEDLITYNSIDEIKLEDLSKKIMTKIESKNGKTTDHDKTQERPK